MAYQGISVGTTPNDGTGDSLYDGALKINSNFSEIYKTFGNGDVPGSLLRPVTTTSINKTLQNNEFCTVTSSGVTVTLPPFPYSGNEVSISIGDFTNTTIARGSSATIMGLAENLTIDFPYVATNLIYSSATNDWRIK
jgi:hypothetical protein